MTFELPQEVLLAFGLQEARFKPLCSGHINTTLEANVSGKRFILQRLNPIFGEEVHSDIEAITKMVGPFATLPKLVRTISGKLWVKTLAGEVWRVLEWLPGKTHLHATGPSMCESAGKLVGRFHAGLVGKHHAFVHQRLGVHDTAKHLRVLAQALESHTEHSAWPAVSKQAALVVQALEKQPSCLGFTERIAHGDLKLSNILFDSQENATALIDLDTLAPMPLCFEMGDALRSWCNPGGEGTQGSRFELSFFKAAMEGFSSVTRGLFPKEEFMSILTGLETVALELSARFLADALNESYFGWDALAYQSASDHNQDRAAAQWSFAQSVAAQRAGAHEVLSALVS